MFYTYICYWDTFQYKYITFHVVKRSHARVTSKDICLLFIILFLCLFPFCLNFTLFHEALLLLLYLIILCTVISKCSTKAKTKATKKRRQKTFYFWCCIEEGSINFVLLLCWKRGKQKKRRFYVIFIYLAWINFPVGPFAKIDNLSKICNLDNSWKKPKQKYHSPNQIYAKIP